MLNSTNSKIVESSYRALSGQLMVENTSGGWCLRVVRQIVQDALKINQSEFYERFLTIRASGNNFDTPCARDIQLSLRGLGYSVSEDEVIPGDLFFSWKPMPYGHVGIVLSTDYVLDNSSAQNCVSRNGFLCVRRIEDVGKVMPLEFFRIP
jgi:hypothetical protein